MRGKLLLGIFVLQCSLSWTVPSVNSPFVEIENAKKDLGIVAIGESISHEFTIRNSGDKPLQLKLKSMTCTCVFASIPDEIPPGGVTEVAVTGEVEALGLAEVGVTLESNDPNKKEITLLISYVGQNPIYTEPSVLQIHRIQPSSIASATFTIKQLEQTHELLIKSIRSSSKKVRVTYPANYPFKTVGDCLVRIEVDPDFEPQDKAKLVIRTNQPNEPALEVPIHFGTSDTYIFEPPILSLSRKKKQDSASNTFSVRRGDKAHFSISIVEPLIASDYVDLKVDNPDNSSKRSQSHLVYIAPKWDKISAESQSIILSVRLQSEFGEQCDMNYRVVINSE